MEWIHLFLGFLISNVLGYGGGPASIPLMYQEIVTHYGWLTDPQFSNMLALGNALPGPIATKIAAYVGYE
ncbi:chromate transporter, partial [Paenibacillus sepulcri]|nr:chromate transporter [Paenibacillus sepulcri]